MRERLEQTFRDKVRAGARPWRADPRFDKAVTITARRATVLSLLVLSSGLLIGILGLVGVGALLGLRPVTADDVKLVAIVRSAIPDVDSLSQDDLVARLAIPGPVGKLLAPLAAADPARALVASSGWLDGVKEPLPVTTPEVLRGLGELASALAPLPDHDRLDEIATLVALFKATHDSSTRAVIGAVTALSRARIDALASSIAFRPLLEAIADLAEDKRETLADGRLRLLPDDPERLHLIEAIPRLGSPEVRLVNSLAGLKDPKLRQALIFVVEGIRSGSPEVLSLLSAYYCRETDLMAALIHPSPGVCRLNSR